MRLQHEHAKRLRTCVLQNLVKEKEVAQRFAHLLRIDLQHPRMHPIIRKAAITGALRLRAFVFVVRKDEIGTATMNIERQTQVLLRHN